MRPQDPTDPYEDTPGEQITVDPTMWADRLAHEVETARALGIESHTRIVDTEQHEHALELAGDVEKVESAGHNTLIWLRNVGIITVTGGAVVAAIALIRHRRRGQA
jgi:hypothetical protein